MEEQALTDADAAAAELKIADDMTVSGSGIAYSAKGLLHLVETGKATLQSRLEDEMKLAELLSQD